MRLAQGRGKWSSSLQEELQNIVTDLGAAGFDGDVIKQVLDQQYRMLDKLGVPYAPIQLP